MVDILGSSWTTALSIGDIVGHTEREVAEMYHRGIKVEPEEHTRVLVEFPRAESDYDPYKRLRQRINEKVKQTKLSEKYFGKLILIECPFDLRAADQEKIQRTVEAELKQSSSTVGIILCKREANPHYRHHYSTISHLNSAASRALPGLGPTIERSQAFDSKFDPITGEPYVVTWSEAADRVAQHAKTTDV